MESWSYVEPVLKKAGPPRAYLPGSWGPEDAERLLVGDGRSWRQP
jgi:glucose-6-phosphate 1-dehydrogenase